MTSTGAFGKPTGRAEPSASDQNYSRSAVPLVEAEFRAGASIVDLIPLTCYKTWSCAMGIGVGRASLAPSTGNIRRGQAQHPCSSLAVEACSELRPYALRALQLRVSRAPCAGRGT